MSEFKEVWYLWDKKAFIPHVVRIMRFDGHCFENQKKYVNLGFFEDDKKDYIAYTLGEKRRRCVGCGGSRLLCSVSLYGRSEYYKCGVCNGTGWEYKKL